MVLTSFIDADNLDLVEENAEFAQHTLLLIDSKKENIWYRPHLENAYISISFDMQLIKLHNKNSCCDKAVRQFTQL